MRPGSGLIGGTPAGLPGGRRTWAWRAVSRALTGMRETLGFRGASILSLSASGSAEVLGSTDSCWQPYEPVRLSWCGASGRAVLGSQLRELVVTLDEAIAVPLQTGSGQAVLLLESERPGLVGRVGRASELALTEALREAATLRHREVDRAYRIVAGAATSLTDVGQVADIALAVARRLTDSDTAYVSVPVDDDRFGFSRTLGVRTDGFRRLRVGPRQGLGSVAQAEQVTARSLDYAADERFCGYMHQVTGQEGIHSAAVAPILADGQVAAVLYVANHAPLAYRAEDESVLSEYASAVGLVLGAEGVREGQRELAREDERRRIARKLHDRLGRQIVELAHLVEGVDAPSQDLARLSASINDCAATLRTELTALDGPQEAMSAAGVVAEIFRVPRIGGMEREVHLHPGPGRSEFDTVIPSATADVLQRIGQEALFNAELHSGGETCQITLIHDADRWLLTVSDDGCGLRAASPDREHLGLKWMHRAAAEVGGRLVISSHGAGVLVECTVPDGLSG